MILGVSGSGKTVLLRQLLHLDTPDSGSIEIDGQDIVPMSERDLMKVRRKIGVVFQDSALLDSMTVFDNVAFSLTEHSPTLSKAERRARVQASLRALHVEHAADKLPGELSGGMKRRVAVARAMVTRPELLIYDEPTRGLDPLLARTVDQLIAETRDQFHVTSIIISHDLPSVLRIGQYVNVLHEGRIAWSSSVPAFVQTKNPQARAFLTASGALIPPPAMDSTTLKSITGMAEAARTAVHAQTVSPPYPESAFTVERRP
jgi:phospholipid/cholesterol/gamma-HCH transport system ATP-binding protein